MPLIELKTSIRATPQTCFDLSLNIDLHMQSMLHTNEKAVGGRTNGQIKLGETVEWKARHFGYYFTMTVKITALESPLHFTDEMVSGPFKRLRHEHHFAKTTEGTMMTDLFDFQSPLGMLGKVVDEIFLHKYMKTLLTKRNELIKMTAEKNKG